MQNFSTSILALALCLAPASASADWRSQMFPSDWRPLDEEIVDGVNRFYDEAGTRDFYGNEIGEGHPDYHPYRFLHDFSYAGYHRGEQPIPPADRTWTEPRVFDVTKPPYNCVPAGSPGPDCTPGIQIAIRDAERNGGGVVYLPSGEYRITSYNSRDFLRITRSGVVLRGDGPDATKLLVDPYVDGKFSMHEKTVISAQGGKLWQDSVNASQTRTPITKDLPFPTRVIPVESVWPFQPRGEEVSVAIVGHRTEAFLAEHDMKGTWREHRPGYLFRRSVVDIDPVARTITIDVPTRYRIRKTDLPEVVLIPPGISEVGLESFSIGMIRHPEEWNYADSIFTARDSRTPPSVYDLWKTRAIRMTNVSHSWIYNLKSYRPLENAGRPARNLLTGQRFGPYDVEVLNEVLLLEQSRHVTVKDLYFRNGQVDTGSANGYAVRISGSENLIENVLIEKMKKGFAIMDSWSSGNVIKDSTTRNPLGASDILHWELSMSNLIDNHTLDGGWWSSVIQGMDQVEQGHSSSQSVFWNLHGLREPDTGIHAVLDRDNDGNGIPDLQEAHGDLPDIGLVLSNQFGWGYVIGTYGPFSAVLTPAMQRAIGGDWSRPHVFPQDYREGIGYSPLIVGSLEPRSLHDAQLSLRLRKLSLSRNLAPWATVLATLPDRVTAGESVRFHGRGIDTDGTVTRYFWLSDVDGFLSTEPTFTTTSLSPGVHTISLRVQDDGGLWSRAATSVVSVACPPPRTVVVDNGEAGTSFSGRWRISAGPHPLGDSSLYSRQSGATYTYRILNLAPGWYRVSLRWTTVGGRRAVVPVEVSHQGRISRVEVNQRENGGKWISLGLWRFDDSARVSIRSLGRGSTCADAVKLEPPASDSWRQRRPSS